MFDDDAIMSKCFNSFLLPCLEYCCPVWALAVDYHLRLLDRVASSVKFLLPNLSVDFWHRQSELSLLHKIYYISKHPLHSSLPNLTVFAHNTKRTAAANIIPLYSVRFIITQFSRNFILATTKMWNGFPSEFVE